MQNAKTSNSRVQKAKPADFVHRLILEAYVHMLPGGVAYVHHLSSFALCAKLAAVR